MADAWRNSDGFRQWCVRRVPNGVELVERWLPESEGGDAPDESHASEPEVVLRWSREARDEVKIEMELYGSIDLDELQAFMLEVSIAGGI